MIIDITGTILIPGNCGMDCPGNGLHPGIECCCNECDYMMCCLPGHSPAECAVCEDKNCPHTLSKNNFKKVKNNA